MQHDRRSPSRTLKEIEDLANAYRRIPGVTDQDGRLDVDALLKALGIGVVIKSQKQMGEERAYADFGRKLIACGREHAKGLRFGLPNIRYDFFHEIGHIAMHPSAELKALKRGGNKVLSSFISEEESEERQAWKFARAIAVPREMLHPHSDEEIAVNVGIPSYAVALRREEVKRDNDADKPKATPIEVEQFLLKNRLGERGYQYVLTAWKTASTIDGKDPRATRMAGSFEIEFKHYGNALAHTGWTVEGGKAYPLMLR